MNKGTDIVNVKEILSIYLEYCEDKGHIFKEGDYKKFIKYLEIDFYDWINGNLRYFNQK